MAKSIRCSRLFRNWSLKNTIRYLRDNYNKNIDLGNRCNHEWLIHVFAVYGSTAIEAALCSILLE